MSVTATRQLVATFFHRHGIRTITLTPMAGVTSAHRVCDLGIEFAGDNDHTAYHAQFKLQGDEARIGDQLTHISATGKLQFVDNHSDSAALESDLDRFFRGIDSRVTKVRQEQSVQAITFLGNSFVLNGKTVFTVVEDVEGRLSIELHKGDERQPAVLLASSLLDGLYDGSIQMLDSGL